jgi:hypothetical protein
MTIQNNRASRSAGSTRLLELVALARMLSVMSGKAGAAHPQSESWTRPRRTMRSAPPGPLRPYSTPSTFTMTRFRR